MEKTNINNKKNLINLALFLSVALISALLIMTAINMLDLPKPGPFGGGNGDKRSSMDSDGTDKNKGNSPDDKELKDKESEGDFDFDDWKERAERRREEKKGETFSKDYAYGEIPGSQIPDNGGSDSIMPEEMPNIDISGNEDLPDMPFGMGEPGKTIVMGDEKRPHVPAFEVLGVPNYPFMKVMVMENYQRNRWTMSKEQPEVKLMLGVEKKRDFTDNSVKVKPIEPSKGYMPVLSGQFELKNDFSVLEYKKSVTYFSEEPISDFYEMEYLLPPREQDLINAKTDDDYPYEVIVPKGLDKIIDEIIENCNSDYEAIKYVEQYLMTHYVYNYRIKNDYGNEDGILSFLLSKREGNYMDFVSSYTFLLKAVGIPCRLAMGYRLKSQVPYQVVYADQTYIYPEIKFEDYGWVPMDVFSYSAFYYPPEDTVTEITFADNKARRGESFTVRGTVKDTEGNSLDDMSVLIYVKGDKEEPCLSYAKARVNNGHYEITCDITPDTGAGKYQLVAELLENDDYRTSSSDPELKVFTDTYLELKSPKTIWGSTFNLSGRLLDSFSKDGVNGLDMNICFDNLGVLETVKSAENGIISKKLDIRPPEDSLPDKDFFFISRHHYKYSVEFKGTDIYYPSEADGSLYMWQIHWIRVMIALTIITGAMITMYLLVLRKRFFGLRNRAEPVLSASGSSIVLAPAEDVRTAPVKTEKIKCFIEFPQIAEGLPDVWGVEEELLIGFYDSEGNKGEIHGTFHKKGKYRVKVLRDEGWPGSRDIRIVVYREEVIAIGKMFLKGVCGKVSGISSMMTLREILDMIKPVIPEERHWVLEGAFSILEKAVYSERDIVRSDYEKFYVFIKELQTKEV